MIRSSIVALALAFFSATAFASDRVTPIYHPTCEIYLADMSSLAGHHSRTRLASDTYDLVSALREKGFQPKVLRSSDELQYVDRGSLIIKEAEVIEYPSDCACRDLVEIGLVTRKRKDPNIKLMTSPAQYPGASVQEIESLILVSHEEKNHGAAMFGLCESHPRYAERACDPAKQKLKAKLPSCIKTSEIHSSDDSMGDGSLRAR